MIKLKQLLEELRKIINERTGEEHPDPKVSELIKKFNKTGRTAFTYPKKKMINVNGRGMSEKKAIEYMKNVIKEK